MEEYKAWIKSLELDLECPVCLDIPQTSLFLCVNGHHVCQSCHKANKLEMCPTCFEDFTLAKNLFLEKFIASLEKLQLSIESEIEKERQKVQQVCREYIAQHQKEMSVKKPVRSVSTQTDPFKTNPPNKQNNQPSNRAMIQYPCIIGNCSRRLEYCSLILHLKRDHSDEFSETSINIGETFSKAFKLLKEELPKIYDFSFFVINMGLFFFNITIHTSGELIARLLLINVQGIRKVFWSECTISYRNVLLKTHGIIRSCDPNRMMISNYQFHFDKDKMSHVKRNKTLDCTLKITENRPPTNNNAF